MIDREQLIDAFTENLDIIKAQAEGLAHADSLLQLPFRGNCLNWVLGHIAESRSEVLEALGEEPVLSEAECARYGYGSEPVTGEGPGVLRMERLLELLDLAQQRIVRGLRRARPEELGKEIEFAGRKMTMGGKVFFLYFHETYHTGQTELLRQLAGTNDKVI